MSYNFFDITNTKREVKKKIFEYCLTKSSFFNINHIFNFNLNHNISQAKVENIWHFDYSNLKLDEISTLQIIYHYCLEESDYFYLCIPNLAELKKNIDNLIDMEIENKIIKKGEMEYIEFRGIIDEYSKKEILNIDFLNILQNIDFEWRYKLFNSILECNMFVAVNKHMGILLREKDIQYLEKMNIFLRDKLLSNVTSYGELKLESFKILIEMFSLSMTKPYKEKVPYFTHLSLYNNDKIQKLYFSFDTLYICFSDLELIEIKEEFLVDISEWVLIEKKSSYEFPRDYFHLTLYDLWY